MTDNFLRGKEKYENSPNGIDNYHFPKYFELKRRCKNKSYDKIVVMFCFLYAIQLQ